MIAWDQMGHQKELKDKTPLSSQHKLFSSSRAAVWLYQIMVFVCSGFVSCPFCRPDSNRSVFGVLLSRQNSSLKPSPSSLQHSQHEPRAPNLNLCLPVACREMGSNVMILSLSFIAWDSQFSGGNRVQKSLKAWSECSTNAWKQEMKQLYIHLIDTTTFRPVVVLYKV